MSVCETGLNLERTLERIWSAKSALHQINRTSLKRTSAPVALERNWSARDTSNFIALGTHFATCGSRL